MSVGDSRILLDRCFLEKEEEEGGVFIFFAPDAARWREE